ncbi:MAG: hypothetical protein AAF512_09460, partial [Pseudomonadota bacterium]
MFIRRIYLFFILVSGLFISGCDPTEAPKAPPKKPSEPQLTKPEKAQKNGSKNEPKTVYLAQGWDDHQRHDFYYLTQGSQLIPYYWFLALETAQDETLFRDDAHMNSLGYITQPPEPKRNPDGLPIGFVKDDNLRTTDVLYEIKKPFLGADFQESDYPMTSAWLGLTCAAC